MQKGIEIKFVKPEDFKKMRDLDYRYEHVDSDNLGFSDKVKNRVFIRSGLDKDLTQYLISHEIEHLYELEGTHEDEHGIRHKKGGFFSNFYDPLGLFHHGNILGIGHNEGKAGLGETSIGQYLMPAIGTLIGGPAGGMLGSLGNMLGNKVFGGGGSTKGMGGGMENMFPSMQGPNVMNSFGSAFGQSGSSASPSSGYGGGNASGLGLMSPGLGQAGISMGGQNQGFGQEMKLPQNQSGFYNPTTKF